LATATRRGDLYLRGMLVAYGGDVDLNEKPGSDGGKGLIDLTVANAQLIYDSSFVRNLKNQSAAITLETRSWQTL
jgi:hypothetical protein